MTSKLFFSTLLRSAQPSLRLAVCAAFVLLATLTAWGDQVTLKNGDRITGAIVKKDGGKLTIKSDLMGVVTVDWDQITDIKSAGPLNVVLAGQTAPAVTKATLAENNGQISLTTGAGAPQVVAPAAIATIRDAGEEASYERLLHPGLADLWAGGASLGLAGTAGNAVTSTFTFAVNAARASRTSTTSVYFNVVKSSSTVNGVSSDTAQAVTGGWKYGRNLNPRIALDVFNDYAYDKFQDLSLRFVFGGGVGYKAWKNKNGALALVGGLDYDHDKFGATTAPVTPAFSRSSAEFYWGDDFGYKVTGATNFTQTFRFFDNLSKGGAYRMNFNVGLNTKISKSLTWNLAFGDTRISDPAAGRKPNDILYTTGIGYTFGH